MVRSGQSKPQLFIGTSGYPYPDRTGIV